MVKNEKKPLSQFRTSNQRLVILEHLRSVDRHLTAEEIYQRVKSKLPSVGLGTVYRNLKFLTLHGYIEEMVPPDHVARYSSHTHSHLHFRCDRCGRIEDFDLPEEFARQRESLSTQGYAVRNTMVEFSGICRSCRKEQDTTKVLPEILCHAHQEFSLRVPLSVAECARCMFRDTCIYFDPSLVNK